MAELPTPVFNTGDIRACFGGADGNSLLLDDQSLLRAVETILFPHTRIELIRRTKDPHIWSIKTSAYPYPGEFFIDARFLTQGGKEASFTFAGKISAGREVLRTATFDESIAEGAMDEEKGAVDGRLAAGRKLAEKVNEAGRERTVTLPSVHAILKTMHRLVGARYIWGGNWPHGIDLLPQLYPGRTPLEQRDLLTRETWMLKGFDCSGLLHYATNGWTPRNTSRLLSLGIPVDIEGKTLEAIIDSLQELDLVVWAGHVICVCDRHTSIESKIPVGVVTQDLRERMRQIMNERRPVNHWTAHKDPCFVVRRWHPN